MMDGVNPFRHRAASTLGGSDFLKLFDPSALDALDEGIAAHQNLSIRSSPGGGKTTILKSFTPRSLWSVHHSKKNASVSHKKMVKLGAMKEDGPAFIACLVSCVESFAEIESVFQERQRPTALFFRLLNARIIIAACRSVVEYMEERAEEGATAIRYQLDTNVASLSNLPESGGIEELSARAAAIEEDILDYIDGENPPQLQGITHNNLLSLDVLSGLSIHAGKMVTRIPFIVMMDDVQYLTKSQRTSLISEVLRARKVTKVWMAERLQALDNKEILYLGENHDRDIRRVNIESYWRKKKKGYVKMLEKIANARIQSYIEFDIGPIRTFLDGESGRQSRAAYQKASNDIQESLSKRFGESPAFSPLIKQVSDSEIDPVERCLRWQVLSFYIMRQVNKGGQTELFFDEEKSEKAVDKSLFPAAEIFLSKNFGLPAYYSFEKVVDISSYNIEQFLQVCVGLFDRMIGEALSGQKSRHIGAKDQDRIIRESARKWHEHLRYTLRASAKTLAFFDRLVGFCKDQTFQPNMPYPPSVTGFAVESSSWEILQEACHDKDHLHYDLADVIGVSLANNLLSIKESSQGGSTKVVFYMNRLFCVTAGLSTGYGGFRTLELMELERLLAGKGVRGV